MPPLGCSHITGTIEPAGEFGTAGNDIFLLTVVRETIEISVNGNASTLNVADVDHMVFSGLGCNDTFTFDLPDGTDLRTFSGAFHVGDLFTVVIDNFAEVNFENRTISPQGDVDLDGDTTFLDISTFVSSLANGDYQLEADINQDGFGNFQDTSPFIDILSAPPNAAPVLDSILDQDVDEHSELSLQIVGTDTDSPSQNLSYELIGNVPSGAVADSNTGQLTWTPDESFGGSDVSITVQVVDDGTGN